MAPSSVPRPVQTISRQLTKKPEGISKKSRRSSKGIFGLLKGWTIDSQDLSDAQRLIMATFFADTYAIVELLKGSPAYRKYKTAVLVTTEFNLCEFAYAVTRDFPDTAEDICSKVRHSMRLSHPGDREYLRALLCDRNIQRKDENFR